MSINKRGFGSNPKLAKKAGKLGGSKSKGRVLTPEHRAKISESVRKSGGKNKPGMDDEL